MNLEVIKYSLNTGKKRAALTLQYVGDQEGGAVVVTGQAAIT